MTCSATIGSSIVSRCCKMPPSNHFLLHWPCNSKNSCYEFMDRMDRIPFWLSLRFLKLAQSSWTPSNAEIDTCRRGMEEGLLNSNGRDPGQDRNRDVGDEGRWRSIWGKAVSNLALGLTLMYVRWMSKEWKFFLVPLPHTLGEQLHTTPKEDPGRISLSNLS